MSRIPLIQGGPFLGHLHIMGAPDFRTPSSVRAYRLKGPGFDLSRVTAMARTLGINTAVQRVPGVDFTATPPRQTTWLVVQEGTGDALRSVAVSSLSGEVIVHDGAINTPPGGTTQRPGDAAARTAARSFLARLGWPTALLPPGPPFPPHLLLDPSVAYVSLSWPGVPRADTAAAAFEVSREPRVREALVLPPLRDSSDLKPRSVTSAWQRVLIGKAPIGVENAIGLTVNGTGRLEHVAVTYVLTEAQNGTIYLVPVYRFSGSATFPGVPGPKTWLALVPAS